MVHLAVKIAVCEYERGWGSKVDDYMVCLSVDDAESFKKEFNSDNDEESTPDWYMICIDEPIAIDLNDKQYEMLSKENRVWFSQIKNI